MIRMLRALLAVACLCAVPSWAMAQDEAFKQGLQARGDKKWPDVVRHMQNALKSDDKESTRKVRSWLPRRAGHGVSAALLPGRGLPQHAGLRRCGHRVVLVRAAGRHQEQARIRRGHSEGLQACAKKGVLLAADYTPLYTSTRQAYMDASALAKTGQRSRDGPPGLVAARVRREYTAGRRRSSRQSLTRFTAGQRTRLASDFNESKAGIGPCHRHSASARELAERGGRGRERPFSVCRRRSSRPLPAPRRPTTRSRRSSRR